MAKKEKKNKISTINELKSSEGLVQNEIKEHIEDKVRLPIKTNNLRAVALLIIAGFILICFCFMSYKVFFGSGELYSSTSSVNVNGLEKINVPDSSILEKSPGL